MQFHWVEKILKAPYRGYIYLISRIWFYAIGAHCTYPHTDDVMQLPFLSTVSKSVDKPTCAIDIDCLTYLWMSTNGNNMTGQMNDVSCI